MSLKIVFVKDKGTWKTTQPPLQHNKEQLILPQEVWMLIWSFLDFKTLQKICIRVSKSWMEMIRSSKLSWEVKFRRPNCPEIIYIMGKDEVEFFNTMIITHWNNLRVIQLSSEPEFDKFHLSLNSHESLEKIVIPSTFQLYFDHTLWGIATKYYIVPSHLLTPAKAMKSSHLI